MLSILSFLRQEQVSTFQDVFSLILSQLSLMKLELGPTDNYSIQSSLFQEKKMPLIILQEVTIQLVKKLLISVLIELENLQINAQDSKDSLFLMLLVEVLDQDLDLSYLKDFQ